MKTLYISDLDGTLLNEEVEVSEYTIQTLNELIGQGLEFSVATARTAASVTRILEKVNINNPVVLMNGALVYDILKNKYINIERIDPESVRQVIDIFAEVGITGFAYTITNHELVTYYERLDTKALTEFYQERVDKYQKKFTKVETFYDIKNNGILYFCLIDSEKRLLGIYNRLRDNPKLDMAYYRDIYSEDLWYLEIYSDRASKYNAVNFVREYTKANKVIGFGDNLNDIPLFKACNQSYAVSNGKDAVKQAADGIIESNRQDGVAKYLKDIFTEHF